MSVPWTSADLSYSYSFFFPLISKTVHICKFLVLAKYGISFLFRLNCKGKLTAKPISTIDHFDLGQKIRGHRKSTFAESWVGKITSRNYRAGKTITRAPLARPFTHRTESASSEGKGF